MRPKRSYVDVLVRELAHHGVERWHIDRSHRHPRLHFVLNGQPVFYVMPASPSDWRGAMKARADLRRMLRG